MSEAAQQWLATLSEVRRQAARAAVLAGVQPPETDGQWYDVAEDRTETSDLETLDETGAWRGLQWLNAFEILVRGSSVTRACAYVSSHDCNSEFKCCTLLDVSVSGEASVMAAQKLCLKAERTNKSGVW